MRQRTSIARNTAYVAIAEMAKPALSFFLILVISRVLGREGVGSYTVVLTFTGLFELIATFGLGPMIVRGVAADKSQVSAYASGAFGVAVLASATLLPVMLLVSHALNYPADIALGIRLLSWTLLLAILQQHVASVCEGLQDMRLRALLSVLDTLGRLIAGVLMIALGQGVLGIIQGMLVVRAANTILAATILIHKKGITIDWRIAIKSSLKMARAGLPFLLAAISSSVFISLSTLMLSKLATIQDVGVYNSATRIMDIVKNVLGSYLITLLPLMSASFVRSAGDFRTECNQSLRRFAIVTAPVATGICVLAPRIIRFVYGPAFDSAIPVIQVLAVSTGIFCLSLVFGRILIASRHQVLDLCCNLAALAMNVVLGMFLIKSLGPIGAAVANLLSVTAFGALEYDVVARYVLVVRLVLPLARAIGASAVMALVITHCNTLPLGVLIVLGALTYAGAAVCVGTFSIQELTAFYSLIGNTVVLKYRNRKELAPAPELPS